MARPKKITKRMKQRFLELLADCGNVYKCSVALNVSRSDLYRYRNADPEFREAWDAAKEAAVELLEDEGWRRAFDGIEKPVFYKGEICGYVQDYSDTLLMHRLNAERPDKYQYRQKIDANVEGNITIQIVKFADEDKDPE
jgi:hypothetical protein